MKYSYFPGCASHGTAIDQHLSTTAVCSALNIEITELPDWNCCGASAGHTVGGELSLALSERNLVIASEAGMPVLVPCASCFSNLRKAAVHLGDSPDSSSAAPPEVLNIATVLSQPSVLETIRSRAVSTSKPLKIAPYYGCLLTRPAAFTGAQHPENPTEIEKVAQACGVETVDWSCKTDCCGGPHTLAHPELVEKMCTPLLEMAGRWGADLIVTACPMCHASLDTTQWNAARHDKKNKVIPVLYLTELVAMSLGAPRQSRWLKRHLVDPRPLLREMGALR